MAHALEHLMTGTNENIIATLTDHNRDKYSMLETVLEKSRFFETLEAERQKSGKPKDTFNIAIKPNLSMMLRRADVGIYTDPFLVVHLMRLLIRLGYTNLCVVETGNLYGNWFLKRGVVQVAARCGYLESDDVDVYGGKDRAEMRVRGGGVDARVPVIDMTSDFIAYPRGDEKVEVGRAWAEADFRISFSKIKTHFYSDYTLSIKNIYGCLPHQDKVRGYHCRHLVGKWTAAIIADFPVHFSIVDAYTAADGFMGVKIKAIMRKPHLIFAGNDIMAVEKFGASLIGVEAEKAVMYAKLAKLRKPLPYKVEGDFAKIRPWTRSPFFMPFFSRLIEGWANIMDFAGAFSTGGYDECFPHKRENKSLFKRLLYMLTFPGNFIFDHTGTLLVLRKRKFKKALAKLAHDCPTISGSDLFKERLTLLTGDDIEALTRFMEKAVGNEIGFSGHYIFIGSDEYTHTSRMSTSNMAMLDFLREASSGKTDATALVKELKIIKEKLPRFFSGPYPYCFN